MVSCRDFLLTPNISKVTVSPTNANVRLGQTQTYTATGVFRGWIDADADFEQCGMADGAARCRRRALGWGRRRWTGRCMPISGVGTARMEAYDPTTNSWTAKAELPEGATEFFGTAALDGQIYVIGGEQMSGNDVIRTDNVYVYDPSTDTWSTAMGNLEPSGGAFGVGQLGATALDGEVYAVGGFTEDIAGAGAAGRVRINI